LLGLKRIRAAANRGCGKVDRLRGKSGGGKQPVRGLFQMLIRAFRARQMSNQISRRPVKIYALEVVELLSLEIEDLPTNYLANMNALAVEDVSVHGWPPMRWSRAKRRPDKLHLWIVNSEGIQVAPLAMMARVPF